ncbi:discoidin domain-containing protein [Paenibacillus silviterrae]|uniref:discoidin domain-containing protein n=1 Tax=Paenibacillus silviterrae TaxID=3242194 RepID=UPI00254348F1|nr:discoidin domain-containing protein [Paenibacillus chinjuensis]
MSKTKQRFASRFALWTMVSLLLSQLFMIQSFAAGKPEPKHDKDKTVIVHKKIYVSPSGSNRTGDGSENAPFQTIDRARDEIRAFYRGTSHAAPTIAGDIIVYLRGGVYTLNESLTFGPEDSGRHGYNVIYQAYPGEKPVISGGQRVTGWQTVSDGVYKAPVGDLQFRQLYINDTRGIRARTPNAGGYYRLKSYNNSSKTIQVNVYEANGLSGGAGTPEMIIQTHWADRHMIVDSFTANDTTASIVTREPERSQVIGNEAPLSEANQSYHFENKLIFLDAPGEWFLDTDHRELYYKPRPGENLSTAQVIAPKLEALVKLEGTLDQPVHHIQFQGISFEHSNWLKPNQGYAGTQATYYPVGDVWYGGKLPGAVQLEAAGNIRFERNTFRHLGATGLELVAGNFDNAIEGNVFTDISGNGIAVASRISTVKAPPSDPRTVDRRTSIRNNYLSQVGQDYYGAVGIFGGYVEEMAVEHNELTDMPYSGISMGWGFTTNTTALKNNTIRYNRISHVMKLLDDGGGIYTLSYQPGTRITDNYIHDVLRSPWTTMNQPPEKEWWKNLGIYLDQNSSGMTVMNNVILNSERDIKTNVAPYGTSTFIRNHNDLQYVKLMAGLEPAYRDIRLTVPTDPPPRLPDQTPPVLLSAVTDETGKELTLKFSEPLESVSDSGVLDASKFILNGTSASVASAVMDYADVKNATVKLMLTRTAGYGKIVTLTLADGAVRDVALNNIAAVTGYSLTNNTLIPYFMKLTMEGSTVLRTGHSARIGVALTTRDGQPVDLSQATSVTYSSADSSIAAVHSSSGVVTGARAGQTKINVHVNIDDIDVHTSVDIFVISAAEPRPALINIAKNKPVQATSQFSDAFSASKVNDGDIQTAWVTGAIASLTLDLLEQVELYKPQRIEVVTRQDADQGSTRRNFEVQGSNDIKFATYEVLGSQGADTLEYKSTWSVDVSAKPLYRYIRFVKSANYAAVAELRVLAAPLQSLEEVANTAVIAGDGELQILWDEPADADVTEVKIYNGDPEADAALLQSVPKGVGTAVIDGLTNGIRYAFTFKTVNSQGKESFGRKVTGTPGTLTNLAAGKPATATDAYSSTYDASKANDGQLSTAWVSRTAASWTVDLGQQYRNHVIRGIEVITRQDADQASTRSHFEIQASNDPSFATHIVLGIQGAEVLPYKAAWSAEVAGTNAYRYVRFVKPIGYAAVAELKVLGALVQAPEEVTHASTYTQDKELILVWDAPVSAQWTEIRIYNGDTLVKSVPAGAGKAHLTGLTNNAPYTFMIRTVGRLGNESAGVSVTGTPKVLTNAALGKPATATDIYSAAYDASKANDNSVATAWISKGTASWTTDLGTAYSIRKLEVVTRQDADLASTRRHFEIRASNDPSFATYTVLGSQGDEALPFKATWSAYVLDATAYRYVRFVKPLNYASVAELRVLTE